MMSAVLLLVSYVVRLTNNRKNITLCKQLLFLFSCVCVSVCVRACVRAPDLIVDFSL